MKKLTAVAALAVALGLSACGGGGSGGGGMSAATSPPPPAPTASVVAYDPAVGASNVLANVVLTITMAVTNASGTDASKVVLLCNNQVIVFKPASTLSADTTKTVTTMTPAAALPAGGCSIGPKVTTNGPGGSVDTPISMSFTVVGAATPPPSWWPPATVTSTGKIVGAGQLPVGCNTWANQCWKDDVVNGTVKFMSTPATQIGINTRPIVFAYFRNTSTAFGVTGLWNVLPFYADDGSPAGNDISGGGSLEIDWVAHSDAGIITHEKPTGLCFEEKWYPKDDPSGNSKIWSNGAPVTCP